MNIDYLIQLLTNRLSGLALAKDQAFSSGDLERINSVDAEILDIQNTLSKLRLVSNVEQAATVSSLTESQIVQRGIESIFTPSVINGSTEVLLKYNIVPYATDPYHETKIQTILENMGSMETPDQIDVYLRKSTPDSPVTGFMIYNSASKYNVDVRLMMAIMELDSRYGTQGLGARTFNPGNVGNNGFEERAYGSWDVGVDAVANWLNNHRIVQSVNVTEPIVVNIPVVENIVFTTTPSTTPVFTLDSITTSPDTATSITSVATSSAAILNDAVASSTASSTERVVNVPVNSATTTEPVVEITTESAIATSTTE
jgi:hypothetical protein